MTDGIAVTGKPQHIVVGGEDLVEDVLGHRSLTEVFFRLVVDRHPTAGELRMLDSILVTTVEHGLTPSALSSRLTYLGSPEAIQAAVAAGLLGAGSRYLGTMQEVAEMLQDGLGPTVESRVAVDDIAEQIVIEKELEESRIPGFGHPIHRRDDPRTRKLFQIAHETGQFKMHSALMRAIKSVLVRRTGQEIPLNAAGSCGAILSDMGLTPLACRTVALVGRSCGLVGHVLDEARQPMAQELWMWAESNLRDASEQA